MRVYKNAWFAKFAKQYQISDLKLFDAVARAESGLVDADLGAGVLKQRVARDGAGKSSGFRTILFFRSGDRAIFTFGFSQNDRAQLTTEELAQFKKAAKLLLAFPQAQIDAMVSLGKLKEVQDGNQDV